VLHGPVLVRAVEPGVPAFEGRDMRSGRVLHGHFLGVSRRLVLAQWTELWAWRLGVRKWRVHVS
jgi:hypothetical protein